MASGAQSEAGEQSKGLREGREEERGAGGSHTSSPLPAPLWTPLDLAQASPDPRMAAVCALC